MGGPNLPFKHVPVPMRKHVIDLKNRGYSFSQISEITKLSKSTVHYIFSKYEKTGEIENKRRGCRPKKFSPREEKLILRKFKVTPTLTARGALKEVQQELGKNASPST
ncbi:unnamed protein product, partial [Allacma fusca]